MVDDLNVVHTTKKEVCIRRMFNYAYVVELARGGYVRHFWPNVSYGRPEVSSEPLYITK